MNQKEIAITQKLSPSKVTRATQAASVPSEMLTLFPIQSELTYTDYKCLLEISIQYENSKHDLSELIEAV